MIPLNFRCIFDQQYFIKTFDEHYTSLEYYKFFVRDLDFKLNNIINVGAVAV